MTRGNVRIINWWVQKCRDVVNTLENTYLAGRGLAALGATLALALARALAALSALCVVFQMRARKMNVVR